MSHKARSFPTSESPGMLRNWRCSAEYRAGDRGGRIAWGIASPASGESDDITAAHASSGAKRCCVAENGSGLQSVKRKRAGCVFRSEFRWRQTPWCGAWTVVTACCSSAFCKAWSKAGSVMKGSRMKPSTALSPGPAMAELAPTPARSSVFAVRIKVSASSISRGKISIIVLSLSGDADSAGMMRPIEDASEVTRVQDCTGEKIRVGRQPRHHLRLLRIAEQRMRLAAHQREVIEKIQP